MVNSVYEYLESVQREKGAGFIVLIDPDKLSEEHLPQFVETCETADVDAFFLGGSLMHAGEIEYYAKQLKKVTSLPIIGFPGSLSQVAPSLDAILYISVVSGRNPEYLFGQHVHAAPLIKRLRLEAIATGYMLVESDTLTTAQYMSHSIPMPRHRPEVAAATALAAEMMGMKLLYTDGGSGASQTVPDEIVIAVTDACSRPLVVGGGLSSPEEVERKIDSGAAFIVIGNAIERRPDGGYISELAGAAHCVVPRPL